MTKGEGEKEYVDLFILSQEGFKQLFYRWGILFSGV